MLRVALALALGFAAVTLAGTTVNVRADDKKDETKKLTGTLTCGKCALGETDKCSNALIVKEGDKKITYYIKDDGNKEKYHACKKDKENVTVTGIVVEKDGKKWITDAKVEEKK